jgi:hypothetical protein
MIDSIFLGYALRMPGSPLHAESAWVEGVRTRARTLTTMPTCGITCLIRSYHSFPSALMSNPIPKVRKARKDSRYSHEEMQVLSKHKQEYREQTTRELRANIFKGKILVDLFNLWLKQGKAPNTEEESATLMKVTWNMRRPKHLLSDVCRSLLPGSGTTGVLSQPHWKPRLM